MGKVSDSLEKKMSGLTLKKNMNRYYYDMIIISTLPHIFAVCVTCHAGEYFYSVLITSATIASLCWHTTRESSKSLMYIDYFLAGMLAVYETYMSRNKLIVLQINLWLFLINKSTDVFSRYDILKYDIGHCIFHIISAYKTYYVAQSNCCYTLDQPSSDFGD